MNIQRYNIIKTKFPREIVLLKGKKCAWGKCTFCDYISDNEEDVDYINEFNREILNNVKGTYGRLEIINSGNVFELPKETLAEIKRIVLEKDIKELYFEAHWIYRYRLNEIRDYFKIPIRFKTGLESFDYNFRENILNKGIKTEKIEDIRHFFDSVCLMVGIKGQTKEMIEKDISNAQKYFNHFTVNVYCDNTTSIKADEDLKKWFYDNFQWLNDEPKCEILWENTDFGVGNSI